MILYIAGPMAGHPDLNYPAFFRAEEQLKDLGYEVLNPARNPGPKITDYYRQGFQQVLEADGIALLDGWRESRGATMEQDIAVMTGLPVQHLNGWVTDAEPLDVPQEV